MTTLNERLKELRLNRNMSQKQLANSIKISDRNYQRYEYGERQPTSDVLLSLAEYFDVSLDYLVGRTDNPDSHKV